MKWSDGSCFPTVVKSRRLILESKRAETETRWEGDFEIYTRQAGVNNILLFPSHKSKMPHRHQVMFDFIGLANW